MREISKQLAAFEARVVEMPWAEAGELTRTMAEVQRGLGEPIRLSFVGNFSVGKSNIINSLLKGEVAAVGVRKTTAVICYFRYGEEERLRLHYKGGASEDAPLSALTQLSSHSHLSTEDEDALRELSWIEVFYPSDALRNITVVDTPGFGSDAEMDDAVTRGHLQDADAVCWVFDAQEVGHGEEVRRVKELSPLFQAAFAVVNKCDEKPASERLQLKRRVESLFEGCFEDVLLYSADLALEAVQDPEAVGEDEAAHLCMDLRAEVEARVKARADILRARHAKAALALQAQRQRGQALAWAGTLAGGLEVFEAKMVQALERHRRALVRQTQEERAALERRLVSVPSRYLARFEACLDVKDRLLWRNISLDESALNRFWRELEGALTEAFAPWQSFARQVASRTTEVLNSVDLGESAAHPSLQPVQAQLIDKLQAVVQHGAEHIPAVLHFGPLNRALGSVDGFVRTLYTLHHLDAVLHELSQLKGARLARFVSDGIDLALPLQMIDDRIGDADGSGGWLARHIDEIEAVLASTAGELRGRLVHTFEFVAWLDAGWPPGEGAAPVVVQRACAACGAATSVRWPMEWPRCGQCEAPLPSWPLGA